MLNYFLLFAYIFTILFFTLIKLGKKDDASKKYVLTRNTNYFIVSFSIVAALVGGNTFVTFTGFVNKYGLSAIWYFIGLAVGLLILSKFIKNFEGLNDLQNISISDYFENIYGRKVSVLLSYINLLRFLSICIIQLIAGGMLLSELLNLPYNFSILIIILTITTYIFIRGFLGVLKSDILQVLFILIPLLIVAPYFSTDIVRLDITYLNLTNFGILNLLLFLIFGIALIVGSADIWQRIICLGNINLFRKVSILSTFLLIIIGLLISFMGFSSIVGGVTESDMAFLYVFQSSLIPVYVIKFCSLAILSAILSTADTFLMGSATIISKDIFRKSGDSLIKSIKKNIIIISLFCLIFALLFQDILNIALFLVNIIFTISPFIFMHLIGKRFKPLSILISFISGCGYILVLIVVSFILKEMPIKSAYGTLIISAGTLLISNYFLSLKSKT